MPADDLAQLAPGAALDAIVAREVFGLDVLGEWPTTPNQDGGPPDLSRHGVAGAVLRPVYVDRCCCGSDGADMTGHFCGVPDLFGHRFTCLAPVPAYSSDVRACERVVKVCRAAGWWDTAAATPSGYIRRFDRPFPTFWGGVDTLGSDEYAVACVAAVRVARLVGGSLVKGETAHRPDTFIPAAAAPETPSAPPPPVVPTTAPDAPGPGGVRLAGRRGGGRGRRR